DVTRDGGFPPLNLDMIDFMGMYRQQVMRQGGQPGAAPLV
ncbi:MAG: protein-export chaperone SecB, partial [Rhodobacteraceae bacterium]|nr:protein-export chaperone SecB [Paracoccaceae bacterium]